MIFNRPAQGGPEIFSDIFASFGLTDQSIFSAMKRSPYVAPLYIRENGKNVGIVYERSVTEDTLAVDDMPEHAVLGTAGFAGQFSPLFLRDENGWRANFAWQKIEELFSDVEEPTKKSRIVEPEDVFDYIYASLHSPSYREKYREFLKTDFPRVPRPATWAEFWRLVELGRELRELHLMKGDIPITTTFPIIGDNLVEKIVRENDRVHINATQYFGKISDTAWNFFIGGYQPAQKWLKDRKGRPLSDNDIDHYQKIITVLNQTDRIMKKIG